MLTAITTPLALLTSFVKVLRTGRYRNCALAPFLLGAVSFVAFFALLWMNADGLAVYLPRLQIAWLPQWLTAWFLALGSWLGYFFTLFICSVLATLCSLLLTMFLASLFYEKVVERALSDRGLLATVPHSERPAVWRSLIHGLIEDVKKSVFIGFFLCLLFAAGFIPILTPLVFLLGIYLVGFDIVDLPLRLSGQPFRRRWSSARRHWPDVMMLGLCFSVLLFIPLATLLFLPAGYLVAIDRVVGKKREAS